MAPVVRFHKIGGPEVLQIEDVEVPPPKKGEVQISIKALLLNRAESMFRRAGRTWKTPNCPRAWVTRRPGPLPRSVRACRASRSATPSGSFKPLIAKTFPLHKIVEAHRYLESNQQIGKIAVTCDVHRC